MCKKKTNHTIYSSRNIYIFLAYFFFNIGSQYPMDFAKSTESIFWRCKKIWAKKKMNCCGAQDGTSRRTAANTVLDIYIDKKNPISLHWTFNGREGKEKYNSYYSSQFCSNIWNIADIENYCTFYINNKFNAS